MKKSEIKKKLLAMRRQFKKELESIKDPDYVTTIIIKTKMVTIDQVMDELGLRK